MAQLKSPSFYDAILNQLPIYDMMRQEMRKRSYILSKAKKQDGWNGSLIPIPFEGASQGSTKMGTLPLIDDINRGIYAQGKLEGYKELYGSVKYDYKDLQIHTARYKNDKQTFLHLFPLRVKEMSRQMVEQANISLLCGPHFATAVANGANTGKIKVNRASRFKIGQKVLIDDENSNAVFAYVRTIDTNNGQAGHLGSGEITFYNAITGGSAVDLSGYTTDQKTRFYYDKKDTAMDAASKQTYFTSLREQLLPSANGGSAKIFDVTKTLYPFTQTPAIDGTGITATNIVSKVFDAWNEIQTRCSGGEQMEVVMSHKNFSNCMRVLETQKGSFNVNPNSRKTQQYAWTEIVVGSVRQGGHELKLVAVQEMDDDIMIMPDWSGITFHSDGWVKAEDLGTGDVAYMQRGDNRSYVFDFRFFGELVVTAPYKQGIIYNISY